MRFRVSQLVDPALHRERGESQRCAFCNYRGKLTSEHIWPERFQTLFPELKMVKDQHGDPRSPLEFDAMAFTGKARIDCDRCNNIKLETIERAAMPHIKFLALANSCRRSTLRGSTQTRSVWGSHARGGAVHAHPAPAHSTASPRTLGSEPLPTPAH